MPGRFEAFVPNPIQDHEPELTGSISRLLSDSDAAVRGLNRLDPARANLIEPLARQLLRQESLASSRIEGLLISHKRISEAGYDPRGTADHRAREVLANIEAMEQAIRIGSTREPIDTETIVALHRTLLRSTQPKIAGVIRDSQNWVGGRYHTPIAADFIPPPAAEVSRLLQDLAAFMNRDDLPATLQAALTHAQFETIHPFADGNGRVGRCLIHVILRRRGLADHHVPPVSLLMATDVDGYVKALTAYRVADDADWTAYFAETTVAASAAAEDFGVRLMELQVEWKEKAGVRRGSTAEKIIDTLPAQPVIDVKKAAQIAGTSEEAARQALNVLEDRGVVKQVTKRNWGRVWEAKGLWNLLDRFEERLATPTGGGRPSRPAPRTR
ncbi:MAG TPA: Fic family protein [Solirubrobacterales bacterium]|nr:Fic family protein [Solirubrobacterales bacterium]